MVRPKQTQHRGTKTGSCICCPTYGQRLRVRDSGVQGTSKRKCGEKCCNPGYEYPSLALEVYLGRDLFQRHSHSQADGPKIAAVILLKHWHCRFVLKSGLGHYIHILHRKSKDKQPNKKPNPEDKCLLLKYRLPSESHTAPD